MIKLTKQFFGHVVPAIIRPLHILLNQVVGLFFGVFAVWAGVSGVRYWRQLDTPQGNITYVLGTFGSALLLAYLAITSFWKARKISRS
jgi:uncharacterized membrane protein